MSNNIKTKNLIYSFNKYVELPYQSSQMIDYSMNNKYPNMVQLNNTYGQCVDNDLFIAKSLLNRINGTSEAGPKLITDVAELNALPDGAKFFSASGSADVMQKHVNSLQSSLCKSTDSKFDSVKIIHKISLSLMVVCTDKATYTMSSSNIDSKGNIGSIPEVKDSNGNSFVVTAVIKNGDMSGIVFAGHPRGTNDHGLYYLKTAGVLRDKYSFQLIYSLQTLTGSSNVPEICALAYDSSSSLVLFATDTTLYSCNIDTDYSASDAKQLCMFTSASICSIIASKSYAVVFTRAGKIYCVPYAAQYMGFQNPSLSSISIDKIAIYDSQYANGIQYFATSNGLQVLEYGQLRAINGNLNAETRHLEVDNLGQVWCGDAEGNIIVASSPNDAERYMTLAGKKITDLKIIDGVKLIVTSNSGLWYEQSHKKFAPVDSYSSVLSTQLLIDSSSLPHNTAYMFTKDGSAGKLSAMNVSFAVTPGTDNYDVITGLSSLSTFDKNGYISSNVFKLVDFNNSQSAFINYAKDNGDMNYAVFNNSTGQLEFDNRGWNVNGIIQAGNDDLYVFTTGNLVERYHLSSNGSGDVAVIKSIVNTPSGLEGTLIYDSLCIDQDHYFATTLSGSSWKLALLEMAGNDMRLVDTAQTGVKSDIVKCNDEMLAFVADVQNPSISRLSSFYTSYVLNPFEGPEYYDSYLSDKVDERYDLYKSLERFQFVNNLSYRVKHTWTYMRSDYIVPCNDENVSAVRSFIEIKDNNGDPDFIARCMEVSALDNTGGVTQVDYAYDISGNTCMSYISSNNAVYSFQVMSSLNVCVNPLYPFTDANIIVHDDVSYAVIDSLSVSKSYDAQQDLTSYIAQLSAYEIGADDGLSAISCEQVSSSNSVANTSSLTAISLAGKKPLMLCKSSWGSYVLLSTGQDTYSVNSIVRSGSACNLDPINEFTISHAGASPKSFTFSYDTNYDNVLTSLPSNDYYQNISITGNSFDECTSYVQDQSYEYEVNHETSSTISSGALNVFFDDARFFMPVSFNGSTAVYSGDVISTQVNVSSISCAVNANQTDNDTENAMLVFNELISYYNVPLFVKTGDGKPLYSISDEKLICGKSPSSVAGNSVSQIGKDDILKKTWLKGNDIYATTLSVIDYDNSNCMTGVVPNDATDIHLVQCCNKSFNDAQHVMYYEQNSIRHEMRIKELSSVSDSTLLASFSSPLSINVLNYGSDNKFPLISYASSLDTLDYENDITFTINPTKTLNLGVESNVKAIALDVDDSSYAYVANGNAIYKCLMTYIAGANDVTTSYDFLNSSSGATVQQVAFIDGAFGSSCRAFANVTLTSSGEKKSVVVDSNKQLSVLDSSQQIESLVLSSILGMTYHDIGHYRIYGCKEDTGSFYLDFTDFGTINGATENQNGLSADDAAKTVLRLDAPDTYVVQAQSCIYQCAVSPGTQMLVDVSCLHETAGHIGSFDSYEDNIMLAYYMSQNERVLSSQDLSTWNAVATIGSSANSPLVSSLAFLSPYYMFASKTSGDDTGFYYTYYSYYTDSNLSPFTAQSAYYAYYDNKPSLDSMNQSYLAEHVSINHDTLNCDMQLILSCMDRSFQIPDGFMTTNSTRDVVDNDYIVNILTGDESSQNVIVYAKNTATGSKWIELKCNYIAKCWKSGLTELYMYLPTTNTYYIPHIEGASMCGAYDEQVVVNEQTLTSNVRDNTTEIRVNVMSRYFTIDILAENTIKANSLPLRIFKDDQYSSSCAGSMFHSFVLPSVAKEFDSTAIDLGYYTLSYYAFGSDAQAIKLTFMNNSPNYDKKFKTITYHANGAEFKSFSGMKSFTQRVYEGDAPVSLYWGDILVNDGSFFTGWSRSSTAIDGDAEFQSGIQVSYASMRSMHTDLYACWVSYTFSANDTTIAIANTHPIDYTIAEITIDPNAVTPNTWQPGNKLIVEYGD